MGDLVNAIAGRSGELFRVIDSIEQIRGAGVGVVDGQDAESRVLRQRTRDGKPLWLILEIRYSQSTAMRDQSDGWTATVSVPQGDAQRGPWDPVPDRELYGGPRGARPPGDLESHVDEQSRRNALPAPQPASRGGGAQPFTRQDSPSVSLTPVQEESLSVFFNCGSMVLGGVALVGEASAAPVSGGISAIAMPLTVASTVAGATACSISVSRLVAMLISDRGAEEVARMDADPNFQRLMTTLDVIQLVDLVHSVPSLTRRLTHPVPMAPLDDVVAGMSHGEWSSLVREVERVADNTYLTNGQIQGLRPHGRITADAVERVKTANEFNLSVSRRMRTDLAAALGYAVNATGTSYSGVVAHVFEYTAEATSSGGRRRGRSNTRR